MWNKNKYDTIFPNEVQAIVAIDWVFAVSKKELVAQNLLHACTRGIDELIEFEKELQNEEIKDRSPLTHEKALERLLKANDALDTDSAKLLLERNLVERNGLLEFSRDIMAKKSVYLFLVNFCSCCWKVKIKIWKKINIALLSRSLHGICDVVSRHCREHESSHFADDRVAAIVRRHHL